MTTNNNYNQQDNEEIENQFGAGHFVRWIGIILIVMCGLMYLSYYLGSNENKRKINRLNKSIQHYGQVESLESLVGQFQDISRDLKLSNNERTRLTELLDQVIVHKMHLENTESELKRVKSELTQLTTARAKELTELTEQNLLLTEQIKEFETAMAYEQGTTKPFTISVNDSFSLLQDPSSRIGLEKILGGTTAQIYVGNALMFFHIGHTLRFRFAPNWLCDITLVKTDLAGQKAEFEYSCDLN